MQILDTILFAFFGGKAKASSGFENLLKTPHAIVGMAAGLGLLFAGLIGAIAAAVAVAGILKFIASVIPPEEHGRD